MPFVWFTLQLNAAEMPEFIHIRFCGQAVNCGGLRCAPAGISDADSSTGSGGYTLWKLWITGFGANLQDFLHAIIEKSRKKPQFQAGIAPAEIEYKEERCRHQGKTGRQARITGGFPHPCG